MTPREKEFFEKLKLTIATAASNGEPVITPGVVRAYWDVAHAGSRAPATRVLREQLARLEGGYLERVGDDEWVLAEDRTEDVKERPVARAVDGGYDDGWEELLPLHQQAGYVVAVRNAAHNKTPAVLFKFNPRVLYLPERLSVRVNRKARVVRFTPHKRGFLLLGESDNAVRILRVAGRQAAALGEWFASVDGAPEVGETVFYNDEVVCHDDGTIEVRL